VISRSHGLEEVSATRGGCPWANEERTMKKLLLLLILVAIGVAVAKKVRDAA
jgi:hypothetical protein